MNSVFDKYYKKYDAWYDKNKFAYLSELEAIKKVLPKRDNGLEIGVGTGRFAYALGITTGIDPSKKMLEIAKKRKVNVKLGYGEKLPFKDSTFGYIAIIITLCFVKDPLKVLRESHRVLKRRGKIIVGIIDKDSFLGKLYQEKKSKFYKEAFFLNVKELIDLLQNTGFNNFTYYQTLFTLPHKMDSVEKPRKGFGKGGFVVISADKKFSESESKIHPVRKAAVRKDGDDKESDKEAWMEIKPSSEFSNGVNRKFYQYERIKFIFKKYGYDMEEARRKVLKRAGEIKEPILDVGTGCGRMAYTIACRGNKVTTIDISEQAQKVASIYARRYKTLGRIRFVNMDAQNMKFRDGSFATVISANLLHDVKEPHKVMREMIRVARPRGKIVISDLNKKGRSLVNKVYRINREVHRGKLIDLEEIVGKNFRKRGISFKKYRDGYITTYVGEKN